jgi:hypothetical protein
MRMKAFAYHDIPFACGMKCDMWSVRVIHAPRLRSKGDNSAAGRSDARAVDNYRETDRNEKNCTSNNDTEKNDHVLGVKNQVRWESEL